MKPILIVDLDETLIKTDLLYELFFQAVKQDFRNVVRVPYWFTKGKAFAKAQLAQRVDINASLLPYRKHVLDLIRTRKTEGHEVALVSASPSKFVESVADHLDLFDYVKGSTDVNLKGKKKLAFIKKSWGDHPFEYVGDSKSDWPIWAESNRAHMINPPSSIKSKVAQKEIPHSIVKDKPSRFPLILKAMRIHQWAKNGLLFIPILASHQYRNSGAWEASILAFFSFSFLASCIYIGNDLMDIESDRKHPSKKNRPFASGALSYKWGMALMPVLVLLAVVTASFLPRSFMAIVAAYVGINLAYSLALKKMLMLDVITLAALYTIRILAGGAATGITLTSWLLAFSVFLFFGLAMIKRLTEIERMTGPVIPGRNYSQDDRAGILSLGVASSFSSVIILVLYLNSPDVVKLYEQPDRLWLTTPLLVYWISRMWLLAHRGQMHDDPVLFSIKDKATLVTGALFFLVLVMAAA